MSYVFPSSMLQLPKQNNQYHCINKCLKMNISNLFEQEEEDSEEEQE